MTTIFVFEPEARGGGRAGRLSWAAGHLAEAAEPSARLAEVLAALTPPPPLPLTFEQPSDAGLLMRRRLVEPADPDYPWALADMLAAVGGFRVEVRPAGAGQGGG